MPGSTQPLAFVAAALLLAACDESEGAPPIPAEPAPLLPSVTSPAPEPDDTPAWRAALAPGDTAVPEGGTVWATVPSVGPLSRIGVFVVDEVADHEVSLTDRLGQRVDGVPTALVHPVGAAGTHDEGDCVLFFAPTTEARLGRVVTTKSGEDIIVSHDAAGTTRTTTVDHLEAPREGVVPLAFVDFPKAGHRSRGIVVARQGPKVFVRTESGHVETHEARSVRALPVPPAKLAVGRRVRAFRWATGFVGGTVASVLEPGLRYEVVLDGNRPRASYFFSNVLPEG